MNLRHSRPSYSYSESAPELKIAEIRIKEDPLLRYNAQLLANFIQTANLKYQILQEALRRTRSRKKTKPNNTNNKKNSQHPNKKSKNKAKSKKSVKSFKINSARQRNKTQQPADPHLQSSEKIFKEKDFEYPIQFLQMLLNVCGQVESDEQTSAQQPCYSIGSNLEYQCSIHPEYVALLKELYSRDYYIEGFHPSQLTADD